jgi:hypothetical protein
VAELAPNVVELRGRTLVTTLPVPGGARTVRLSAAGGRLRIDAVAGRISAKTRGALTATATQMFRLDEDLSGFYAVVSADGDLSWCAQGAGQMLRAPTVFEDVVKTMRTYIRSSARLGSEHTSQSGRAIDAFSPHMAPARVQARNRMPCAQIVRDSAPAKHGALAT